MISDARIKSGNMLINVLAIVFAGGFLLGSGFVFWLTLNTIIGISMMLLGLILLCISVCRFAKILQMFDKMYKGE